MSDQQQQEQQQQHEQHTLPNSKHQWSIGRAPWYTGAPKPFVIGVTGGSASGKTSVCQAIVSALNLPWVGLLSMDRYYKVLNEEQIALCKQGRYNFDHPDAFDVQQLEQDLSQLREGKAVEVPIYDFVTHSRSSTTDRMYGVDIVIVEGILLFYPEPIRKLLDLKIYVDTDNDLRLSRRIKRDIVERGRSVENVLEQYQRTVKPSFEQFIQPTKRFADLIVPWNDTNQPAIDLLTQHIAHKLAERQRAVGIQPPLKIKIPEKKAIPSPFLTSNSSVLIHSPSFPTNAKQNELDMETLQLSPQIHATTSSGSTQTSPVVASSLQPRDSNAGFSQYNHSSITPVYNPLSESITAAAHHHTAFVQYLRSLHKETAAIHCTTPHQISPMTQQSSDPNQKQHAITRTTMLFPEHVPNNLLLLPPTKSMIAIHTTLRDKKTDIDTFRFNLCRLVRILSSEAMNLVLYQSKTVITPTGESFHGLQCNPSEVVAVSIVRAGEAFEHPVRDVVKDITIGKIVIQHLVDDNDKKTGPRLYYAKLPPVNNPHSKVLLFDGVLSTGSAVIMAIHVLLDHGCLPENIIFCCIAAAPEGIYAVTSMFPQITIITSALEEGVDEYFHAVPGVAFVADRYFGTMRSNTAASMHTLDASTIARLNGESPTNSNNSSFNSTKTTTPQQPHYIAVDDQQIEVVPLDCP